MFYPELSKISSNEHLKFITDELIKKLDNWLACLTFEEQDKITVSQFSTTFEIDYNISRVILEKCCELNVLQRTFGIRCPNCGHIIKVTDEQNLYKDIESINSCYCCDSEEIEIEPECILILYKLIRRPQSNPDDIQNLFKCSSIPSEEDTILQLINNSKFNMNNLFYNPTEEEYNQLELLYRGLDKEFECTTDQGNSFEELVKYLLNRVRPFTSENCRTSINQIDCFVRNTINLECSVFKEIGNIFYCECKHEKKVPGNTYFHKLNSILELSKYGKDERRFGIVFSYKEPASTSRLIAHETYLHSNIILISISVKELHDIIFENENFLDLIERKIVEVQHDTVTDLKKAGLY